MQGLSCGASTPKLSCKHWVGIVGASRSALGQCQRLSLINSLGLCGPSGSIFRHILLISWSHVGATSGIFLVSRSGLGAKSVAILAQGLCSRFATRFPPFAWEQWALFIGCPSLHSLRQAATPAACRLSRRPMFCFGLTPPPPLFLFWPW